MVDELNKVITDYLQARDTDYAIMINGKWGCGKSYYIDHTMDDVIRKIKIEDNSGDNSSNSRQNKKTSWPFSRKEENNQANPKYYEKAYISLYGITDVNDFHLHVAYGLNPILAHKWVKAIGTVIARAAAFFNADITIDDKSNLEFGLNKHVLVFDDLERISPQLSVIDVMGWINSFVEHQKCKVIIVCNEDAIEHQSIINNDSRYKDYLQYKEKTVRFTHFFESNPSDVYDVLIENKDAEVKTFYEKYKYLVLDLFAQGGEKNLRTLIFILDCLYKVCQSAIEQNIADEIIEKLIITFVTYAMEHKKGATREQLNTIVKEELDWSKINLDFTAPGPEATEDNNLSPEKEKSKQALWKSSVGDDYIDKMYRMPELVDYIITGNLNMAELNKTIERQSAEFRKQQGTPQGKLVKELHDYTEMSDSEFPNKIEQLKANIENNQYNMYELLDIYTLLNRFSFFKIQGFKITDEIDNLYMRALDKAAATHVYEPRFELCVPMWDPSDKSEAAVRYNKLKEYAMQWNKKREQTDGKDAADRYITAVKENDIVKLREYRKNENSISLVYNMNWEKLWKLVIDKETPNPVACVAIDTMEYWVVKYGSEPEIWQTLYDNVKEYLGKNRRKNMIRVIYLYPLMTSLKERIYGR